MVGNTDKYFFRNLWYHLFWKPKKNVVYKNKSSVRTYIGFFGGTDTEVYLITKEGKKIKCSFKIYDNGKVSIMIKKRVIFQDVSRYSFTKNIKRDYYTGQGSHDIRTFTYLIKEKYF